MKAVHRTEVRNVLAEKIRAARALASKRLWRIAPLILLLALSTILGCTRRIVVPPVTPTPTGTYHTGMFVWFDLLTDNVRAVKHFYGDLLGWEFEDDGKADPLYTVITHQGVPIGGIVASEQLDREVRRSRWVGYLSVPDVDEAVAYVREQGGVVHTKAVNLRHRGRMAVVSDPQGAVLALVRTENGDPADVTAEELVVGRWFWNELWTSDLDAATSFYQELAGYEQEVFGAVEGSTYYLMRRDERPRAGILKIPFEGVFPNWLPYVMVADPSAVAGRVEGLGGQVLLRPEGVSHGGSAIIADPTGAAFAVQKWPPDNVEGQ